MPNCNPQVIDVPGAAGQNGFTTITSNFIVPAAGANVTVSVGNSLLLPVGLKVVLVGTAHFQVAQIFSPTSVSLTFLNYPGDVAAGSTISLGAVIPPSDGMPAFTTTLAGIALPAANTQTIPISVVSSAPFVVGENVVAGDGTNIGTFKVFSKTTGFVTLTWLNASGDSVTTTVIAAGAILTPIGQQGAAGFSVVGSISSNTGQTQALTTTPAQAAGLGLTLAAAAGKTYLLFARVLVNYVGATFAANRTVTFKLRRTNNTPGDITNGITTFETAVITTLSYTAGSLAIVAIPYTTSGSGDIVQPFISIDVLPTAGSIQVIEGNITAAELS